LTDHDDGDELRDIAKILDLQTVKIGELLDYNQTIIKVCRAQADNWKKLATAYIECAAMANEIAEQCALVARVSVDRAGDVISTEWGIEEIGDDDDEDSD